MSESVRSSSQPDPAPPGRCSAAALLLNLPFPLSGSAANGRQCGLKVGPPPAADNLYASASLRGEGQLWGATAARSAAGWATTGLRSAVCRRQRLAKAPVLSSRSVSKHKELTENSLDRLVQRVLRRTDTHNTRARRHARARKRLESPKCAVRGKSRFKAETSRTEKIRLTDKPSTATRCSGLVEPTTSQRSGSKNGRCTDEHRGHVLS